MPLPQSLILEKIESTYVTSYYSVIIILVLLRTVSVILQVFRAPDPTLIPNWFLGVPVRLCRGQSEQVL